MVEAAEVGRGRDEWRQGSTSPNYELLTIRAGGMIVRIREFDDEGDALEAAGLSE